MLLLLRQSIAERIFSVLLQVQSTMGTVKLAEVAEAAAGAPLMMFQLYVIKDRTFCRNLILGAVWPCLVFLSLLATRQVATYPAEETMHG